ncbi:hemocyte protein-glutamine gamma-glutamyltransferase-like protein [Dinothrombium tinctorium]|uniref:Hemocyte protein-glutamine gamma-glutamyltransferase-like protein n=1 Tax=Dinothrombium tinctorium TaxID=1965070 RepID=A0A443RFB0_9ACAR|nr:hemocyte protein-glutamine gamma-glutamyltransferase-like protein [Dinothrombium tinctorium]
MEWQNPISITRSITDAISAYEEDDGLLVGKWQNLTEFYNNLPAKLPWHWLGSDEILEEFSENNGRKVAYGQCWVFACLLTTILRFLGVPSRPVTIFRAGHDSNFDVVITMVIKDDQTLNVTMSESLWNFHVWTEAWIRRIDLNPSNGSQYDGWQILDSTPQIKINNKYQIGPVPKYAIYNADVFLNKETCFIYCTVNCDVHYVSQQGDILGVESTLVGRAFMTKSIGFGENRMADITHTYKDPEGSVQERTKFNRARAISLRNKRVLHVSQTREINFSLSHQQFIIEIECAHWAMIGEPVKAKIFLVNYSNKNVYFNIYLEINSMYYSGEIAKTIFDQALHYELKAKKYLEITVALTPEEYLKKLVPFSIVQFQVVAHNYNTSQILVKTHRLIFVKPELRVTADKNVLVGQNFSVQISLTNFLRNTLTDCKIKIRGLRIGSITIEVESIKPKEKRVLKFNFKSANRGTETIMALFSSKQLDHLTGEAQINII